MWLSFSFHPMGDYFIEDIHINMDLIVHMHRDEHLTVLTDIRGNKIEVIATVEQIFEDMRNAVS